MNRKPIVPRAAARTDVDEAIDYYDQQGGGELALRFIASLERAYGAIGRDPKSGSPRYAHELSLPGLRTWPLRRFPHLVFYVERSDSIDILRVLHGERDLPRWLRDPGRD